MSCSGRTWLSNKFILGVASYLSIHPYWESSSTQLFVFWGLYHDYFTISHKHDGFLGTESKIEIKFGRNFRSGYPTTLQDLFQLIANGTDVRTMVLGSHLHYKYRRRCSRLSAMHELCRVFEAKRSLRERQQQLYQKTRMTLRSCVTWSSTRKLAYEASENVSTDVRKSPDKSMVWKEHNCPLS